MHKTQRDRTISPILAVSCLLVVSTFGQSSPLPQFEVADVRPAVPLVAPYLLESARSMETTAELMSGRASPTGGVMRLRSLTMRLLITLAYKEIIQDGYISANKGNDYLKGGPGWLESDRFDLLAEGPPNATADEQRLMIQAVLIDRFHLAVHREQKIMPAYGLVVEKRGTKLQPAGGAGNPECTTRALAPPLRSLVCHDVTMALLAARLPFYVGQPVTDLTGIQGSYDVRLDIAPGSASQDVAPSPTVFEALGKLGLKLEPRKQPMPVIVIDHVDRVPTQN